MPILLRNRLFWLAVLATLIGGTLLRAAYPNVGKTLPENRLAYEANSSNSLRGINYCLLANWTGRLNLRDKLRPPPSSIPVSRVHNPVRHIVVDVYDLGTHRKIKAFSRHGQSLDKYQVAALDRCRTGPVLEP